ncbi:MAG: hypothetical protein L6R38_009721 [Xanthoria sp. 2 TBL-2021]|nr:MAG: hypothetical protein L6R38_009721 [Xanthoria sp. 2 TBL-2021]
MDHLDTLSQMDSTPEESSTQQQAAAAAELQFIKDNPQRAYDELKRLQALKATYQANTTPSSSTQPSSPPLPSPTILGPDFATLIATAVAQALAQVTQNYPPPAPLVALPLQTKAPPTFRSEKLPDIPEYDGERDRLDAWEQSFIQKMTANNDRFPEEHNKKPANLRAADLDDTASSDGGVPLYSGNA